MRTLHLSKRERRQLERQLRKSQDVRLYRRTLAILQVDRGATVTEVALALRVSRPSIYRWMERYQESLAMESLRDRSRSGRPAVWTEECSEWLQSLLSRSPAELGYFAVNWTVPLLRDSLKMCSTQKFSDITMRRALRCLDYVWKRPRYVLAPDPEREKKRRIRRRIRSLPPHSVLLVEDETDVLLFPLLRANWSRRGEPACVLISGRNARRVVFGAMNLRTGKRLFLARQHQRQHDFQT